ncbi:hypothetical protein HanIR_Chr14g0719791 [Helianthus annuus]|nr:hypothetical protein HanIR_Chr14g0719791 [Helianthus annuus]
MAEGSKESTSNTVSQQDITVEDAEDTFKSAPNSPNYSNRVRCRVSPLARPAPLFLPCLSRLSFHKSICFMILLLKWRSLES